ncbi:MAG: 50S ribosomal protein L32e [Thermoplasmata archaeon]|nr:MAG: 50S ribosomal protein L32e [Thermoplasmata archaeon]RLF36782.1 MAG: 50S ribosomal protein L32e [Thermoplasmata archaeon]
MKKEDVIKEFTKLKGIGRAKAELLYNSGYDSMEKLRQSSVEDLMEIKGFTEKIAREIKQQIEKKETRLVSEKTKATESEKKKAEAEVESKKEPVSVEETVEIVEEEKGYVVKKKPVLSKEQKEKLLIRKKIKQRKPRFLREEWFRYKRIPMNWRRPDGITSKMRINLKYRPSKVRVGFRGPREVRGLHPSGFEEVIVHNVKDLEGLDPKRQAIRIGSTVGTRKRLEIAKRADEMDLRILNMRR